MDHITFKDLAMENQDFKKPKIIVLDDSPSILQVLSSELENDYEVVTCQTIDSLFEALHDYSPDLILLDIILGKSNGFEVCKRLNSDMRFMDIPVILMTSLEDEASEEAGFSVGAVDYIKKPLRLSILKARVKTHVELKLMRDYFKRLSSMDGLTGLHNKRSFTEHLQIEWLKGLRSKEPLSLIMMDIDYFKKYNDHYGHIQGDDCLKNIAGAIEKSVDGGFCARFGGEEFACILPGCDAKKSADTARKIRKSVADLSIPHEHSTVSDKISLSIGIATAVPRSELSPEDVIRAADACLYSAKEKGRDLVDSVNLDKVK